MRVKLNCCGYGVKGCSSESMLLEVALFVCCSAFIAVHGAVGLDWLRYGTVLVHFVQCHWLCMIWKIDLLCF